MTTHPVLAAAVLFIAAWFAVAAFGLACWSAVAGERRLRVAFAVLCVVMSVITAVLAAAGKVLL